MNKYGEEDILPGVDITHNQLFFLSYAQVGRPIHMFTLKRGLFKLGLDQGDLIRAQKITSLFSAVVVFEVQRSRSIPFDPHRNSSVPVPSPRNRYELEGIC